MILTPIQLYYLQVPFIFFILLGMFMVYRDSYLGCSIVLLADLFIAIVISINYYNMNMTLQFIFTLITAVIFLILIIVSFIKFLKIREEA